MPHTHIQMKSVLERGGGFSGINRKVQLKPLKWDSQTFSSDELHTKLKLVRPGVSPPLSGLASPSSSSSTSTPTTPATSASASAVTAVSYFNQSSLRRSTTQEGFARFDMATPTVSAPSSPTKDNERVTQALLILKVLIHFIL
jgi:hypothetical protein